jgi:hypothetical protein
LQWNPPRQLPHLADAYVVARTDVPAEAATIAETKYEDNRYPEGKEVTYRVTAARRVEGNLVMGVGPEETTLVVRDKTPPAVPTGLDVREADTGAFLVWEPNGERDLAGYRVYRSERQDGGFKPVGPAVITGNGFLDTAYRSGFYYAVAAVDESRNESGMSAAFRGP